MPAPLRRILVVSNFFPPVAVGGYERRCARVAERLAAEHSVRVLTSDAPLSTFVADGREPDRQGDIEVRREMPHVGIGRRDLARSPADGLRALRRLQESVESFRPDVVYVWKATHLPQALIAKLLAMPVPLAFCLGDGWISQLYGTWDPFTRHLFAAAPAKPGARAVHQAFRVVNRVVPQLRLEQGPPRDVGVAWVSDDLRATTVLPPAIRPVVETTILPFSPYGATLSRLPRRPSGIPTIVFSGRVELSKGIETAVRAMAPVVRSRPDARLVVVGRVEPARADWLHSIARSLGLPDGALDIRGMLAEADLGEVYATADVLVMPSEYEPGGLVALDAACARIPVVAARTGGIPELLRPDTEALFVPPRDAEALGAAVLAVLDDPERTRERVAAAFARSEELSEDAHVADTVDFLERVVDRVRVPMR